jgi:hypothetical protein
LVDYLNDLIGYAYQFINGGRIDYNATSNPRWRFVRNEKNDANLDHADVLNIMKIPADSGERDPAIDGPELTGDNRYYWGDEFAIRCYEDIFQMKFILFDTSPNINRAANVVRVGDIVRIVSPQPQPPQQQTDPKYNLGYVVQRDADNTVVEKDDYTRETVPNSQIDPTYQDDGYKVYCLDPIQTLKGANINRYAFILYDPVQPHFEALYMITNTVPEKYIFTPLYDIPSYIKYMIFVSCYRFLNDPSKSSPFSKIPDLNKELNQLQTLTNIKINDNTKVIPPGKKLQYGGAPQNNSQDRSVQNLATQYLASSSSPFAMYDSNLGYYIVIDMEVYPGDHIDAARSLALSCSNKYNKMWGALADMVGQPYQYTELIVPGVYKKGSQGYNAQQQQQQRGGKGVNINKHKHKTQKSHKHQVVTKRIHAALTQHHNKTNKQKLHSFLKSWHAATQKAR